MDFDPRLPFFVPARRDDEMEYRALRCTCGCEVFYVSGWPRVISGRGGFFWRTLARVWREMRLPMRNGEPLDAPFWLPVFARCRACDREEVLLDRENVVGRMAPEKRDEPKESYRCRVCRRSSVELVVGVVGDDDANSGVAVECVVRCHRCHRQARVAWSDGRPSDQDIRLDLLYGRR